MFAGLALKAAPYLIALVIGLSAGGWGAWQIQGARLASLKEADAEAEQKRLQQAAQESAAALAVQQQTIAEQNTRIGELTADRDRNSSLLTSLNDRIAHAPTGSGCGPLRAAVDGLR